MADIKRVTLYKVKDDADFGDYLAGDLSAYDHFSGAGYEIYLKYDVGSADKSEEDIPWIRFLNSGPEGKKYDYKSTNRYPRAVMAIGYNDDAGGTQQFVATFGQHADTFIDKAKLVYDFGIKLGMNLCDVDGLRRVQTMAHESISRQTERQASIGTNLRIFGINADAEFLRTISGNVKPAYRHIVESFRGRESISIKLPKNKAFEWNDLISICKSLDAHYGSDEYKSTEFRVYDVLRLEKDPEVVAKLDEALCNKLANKDFSRVHLCPPEFVESEDLDFAYTEAKGDSIPKIYEDLRVEDLVGMPGRRLKDLTISAVKGWKIHTYDTEQNKTFARWRAYQCFVAEIDLNGKTYVLASGQWREISPELITKVKDYFSTHDLNISASYLPENVSIFDDKRQQYREEIYNRSAVSNDKNLSLFDKSKIKIAGQRLYEICDLLHTGKTFIHVKRYTSGASSISHIFTQTKLYSHAFSTDNETRKSIVEWIDSSTEAENQGKDINIFKSIIPIDSRVKEEDYTVIFCVLHDKSDFDIQDLPFMSQYELMLSHKYLTEDRRFNVGIAFRRVA